MEDEALSPRQKFDRYMIAIGAGRNKKFVRLTDSERCAHFLGVLSLAAQSPIRGYLLITEDVEVEAGDVANEAGGKVTPRIAETALQKLKDRGVLLWHEDMGAWYVNDWDEINPAPKTDNTAAERQARRRERLRAEREGHASVTPVSRRDGGVTVTLVTPTEVEGEVEVELPASAGRPRKRVTRHVDQAVPPVDFPTEKLESMIVVLGLLHDCWDLRGGVEPMTRGAALGIQRKLDVDHVAVARKLVHWLTAGRGQNARCADIAARFGDWVADEPTAEKRSNVVVPFGKPTAGDLIDEIRATQAQQENHAA